MEDAMHAVSKEDINAVMYEMPPGKKVGLLLSLLAVGAMGGFVGWGFTMHWHNQEVAMLQHDAAIAQRVIPGRPLDFELLSRRSANENFTVTAVIDEWRRLAVVHEVGVQPAGADYYYFVYNVPPEFLKPGQHISRSDLLDRRP